MNYTVYMHVNKSNNKKYVGITSKSVNERWRNGNGYKSQVFWKAIEKYSWDGFEHIIVAKGLSEEEAKWLEIQMIETFDTTDYKKGYNVTLGGEGSNGHKRTKETKKKISQALSGKPKSKEHCQKLRGENNPMYGRCGANHPSSKAVRCIETGQIYDSATEASKALGKNKCAVAESIRNHYKCGGYHWEYVS